MTRLHKRIFLFILLFSFAITGRGYNLRQLTTDDGLSNSAILSLCFQKNGLLWIGTLDGLDVSDGNIVLSTKNIPELANVPGNIIECIQESEDGVLWIQTNYGVTRVEQKTGVVNIFPQFHGQEKLIVGRNNMVFILTEDGRLSYFDKKTSKFKSLVKINVAFSDVKLYNTSEKSLRLYTTKGILDYSLENKDGEITVGKPKIASTISIQNAFSNEETIIAINDAGDLLAFRPGDNIPVKYANISGILAERGEVSSIVSNKNGDIFISFYTDGVIALIRKTAGDYETMDLKLNVGVLCMAKSPQDVICIGTDCHGIYTFFEGRYNVQYLTFQDLENLISRPVRAVYIDESNNLWLGTKGDGLMVVPDFDFTDIKKHGSPRVYNTSNSELGHNSVYSFAKSRRPILWIADEGGISYYSYSDNRIHKVNTGNIPVKWVSSIYENGDFLYFSTNGDGVFKAQINGADTAPSLTDIRRYYLNDGAVSSNFFFTQSFDKGEPLFGNRGLGVFKISGDSLIKALNFKNDYPDKTINDVFSIVRDEENVWLGTGHGLLKVTPGGEELYFGPESGFLNSTIHSVLKDNNNGLWLSTNNGLVRFDAGTGKTFIISNNYGLPISEFSDGAAFKTGNIMLFGGVDGLVMINPNENFRPGAKYLPEISLVELTVMGQNVPISTYIKENKDNKKTLRLKSSETSFRLTFMVPDLRNAAQYRYLYSVNDGPWVDNGTDSKLSFTEMNSGNYTLRFKYLNTATDEESEPYELNISIAFPWYATIWAKVSYVIFDLAIAILIIIMLMRRQKRKQKEALEALERSHKDEIYEQKLKFFTNVTHEFCTPLTLIFGSCERLMSTDPDTHIRKYADIIRSNTRRLNSLIQDLINFRKYESGMKALRIIKVNVSEVCEDLYQQFKIIAEQNGIKFQSSIKSGIIFNTDYDAFVRIVTNLLSNAFKYTSSGGEVKFSVSQECEKLKVSIYNTGKGISEKEKSQIFDHFRIFDNIEENATKGLSSRHGLGLAICDLLVKALSGSIEIQSEVGRYADFIVTLPPLECNEVTHDGSDVEVKSIIDSTTPFESTESSESQRSGDLRLSGISKHTILVVDDNLDILTLLSDSLSEYNILTATNGIEGMEILKEKTVDLVITDIMMPGVDGISFTRQIKGNKHTMHLPLIILSAKNTSDDKVQGLESGADAYVAKPFYMSYLRALIVRLLESRSQLKEYYNTSASAFEYSGGQLVDKESKDFIDKIVTFIDENLDDTELSPESLASHMKVSTRNLYRKFKDLELPSPNDFIKQHRLAFAAKLLVTTSLTVQEIIYRSGFNNRSHFYREFDKAYGMTPKEYRTQNKGKIN